MTTATGQRAGKERRRERNVPLLAPLNFVLPSNSLPTTRLLLFLLPPQVADEEF
jgi:hypothetical protein